MMNPNPRVRVPTRSDLRMLCEGTAGLRVSLFIPLPERPGFPEIKGFPRQFEAAVETASLRMGALGLDEDDVDRFRRALRGDGVGLGSLPRGAHSLALYFGPEGRHLLGVGPAEGVFVGRSYRLRPVLAALRREHRFRVVALSNRRVALFEGDGHGLRIVTADAVPQDLVDALGAELEGDSLQYHSGQQDGTPIYHGHGGARDARILDRERFHTKLASALRKFWPESEVPVVLAADESHQGRLRKHAPLPGLLQRGLVGGWERLAVGELHERALSIVQDQAVAQEHRELRTARGAVHRGRAVERLAPAAAASVAGRVERLWIDPLATVALHLDRRTGNLVETLGEEDALDELAALTLHLGGAVSISPEEGALGPDGLIAELRG